MIQFVKKYQIYLPFLLDDKLYSFVGLMKNQGFSSRGTESSWSNLLFRADIKSRVQSLQGSEAHALIITNMPTQHKIQYGEEFRGMLYQREQVLKHLFSFDVSVDFAALLARKQQQQKLRQDKWFKDFLKEVKIFLDETVTNIMSITFRKISEKKMSDRQARGYASKNVLINVYSILRESVKSFAQTLKKFQNLKEKQLSQKAQNVVQIFKNILIQEVDEILKNILSNLSGQYPQVANTLTVPGVREILTNLDRMNDQQNDFIFIKNILIKEKSDKSSNDKGKNSDANSKEKKEKNAQQIRQKDLISFIMRVINKVIKVNKLIYEQVLDKPLSEVFLRFNQQLFWISQLQQYQKIINSLDGRATEAFESEAIEDDESKGLLPDYKQPEVRKKELFKFLTNYFSIVLEKSDKKISQLKEFFSKKEKQVKKSKKKSDFVENEISFFQDIIDKTRSGIEEMRDNKTYEFQQMIPSFVEEFSNYEIENGVFNIKHWSIITLMKKWIEQLQEILKNPLDHIKFCNFQFKTTQNQLVDLKNQKVDKKTQKKKISPKDIPLDILFEKVNLQYKKAQVQLSVFKEKKKLLKDLLNCMEEQQGNKNKTIEQRKKIIQELKKQYQNQKGLKQSTFALFADISTLDESQCQVKVGRYSNIRSTTQKLCSIMGLTELKYLKILIDHLLIAGRRIETDYGSMDINLVKFKVNDVLKAKFECSRSTAVRLLKTIYLLDNNLQMNKKFKLTRVRNNLSGKEANLVINYLLMSLIQCELQLIISPRDELESRQADFHEFISRVQEGNLGVIAELAFEAFKADPMLKMIKLSELAHSKDIGKKINYLELKKQNILKVEYSLDGLIAQLQKNKNQQIKSYEQLCKSKDQDLIFSLKQSVDSCILFIFIQIDDKLGSQVLVQFTPELFSSLRNQKMKKKKSETWDYLPAIDQLAKQSFSIMIPDEQNQNHGDFVEKSEKATSFFSYINITENVQCDWKDSIKYKFPLYRVGNICDNSSCLDQLWDKYNVNKQSLMLVRDKFETYFRTKEIKMVMENRVEKIIVKTKVKWRLLNKVGSQSIFNLNFIRHFYAVGVQIQTIPNWISKCTNLTILTLDNNCILDIVENTLPSGIVHLSLSNNKLQAVHISTLVNLTYLSLSGNKELTVFDFSHFKQLVFLDIGDTAISSLNLVNFTQLQSLYIQRIDKQKVSQQQLKQSKIKSFKNQNSLIKLHLSNMKSLRSLKLIENDSLENLHKLQEVNLNKIDKLTTYTLTNVKSLKVLKITNCPNFESLTFTSGQILEELDLSNNSLKKLDISNAAKLKKLNLRSNKFKNFSMKLVGKDNKLEYLDLNQNQIIILHLSGLTFMKNFSFTKGSLQSVTMEKFSNLTALNLSENNLEKMSIDATRLSRLNLAGNVFTTINLDQYSDLEQLDLSGNKLNAIRLQKLSKLRILKMNQNRLQSIFLRSNAKLEQVFLRGNRLKNNNQWILDGLSELVYLDLSNNLFDDFLLPKDNKLDEINLSRNKLKTIPRENIQKVKKINLSANYLTKIDMSGWKLLHQLDVSGNSLQEVEFGRQNTLFSLNLSNNLLTAINLSRLESLQEVDLSDNCLINVDFRENIKLKKLNVNLNKITEVELNNPQLYKAEFRYNNLKSMDFSSLSCLKHLDLSFNELTNFQIRELKNNPGHYELQNLVHLFLGNNFISFHVDQKQHESIRNLLELQELDLSHNLGVNKTFSIRTLGKLREMNLSGMKLNKFDIGNFLDLKIIRLTNNSLAKFNLSKFTHLQILDLSFNQLKEIDLSVQGKCLKQLYLSNNNFSHIDLSKQKILEILDLSKNQFEVIDLRNNSQLLELNLSQNKLEMIDLWSLEWLNRLNLASNQLTLINLNNLKDLQKIDLSRNKLLRLDLKVQSQADINAKKKSYSSLKSITLAYNKDMKEVTLQGFNKFEELILDGCKIECLNVCSLIDLQRLVVRYGKIKTVKLKNLPNLRHLDLSWNKLQNIFFEKEQQQQQQPKIQQIANSQSHLSYNSNDNKGNKGQNQIKATQSIIFQPQSPSKIEKLPLKSKSSCIKISNDDVEIFKSLKTLRLSNNQLKTLKLSQIPNLTKIDIIGNKFLKNGQKKDSKEGDQKNEKSICLKPKKGLKLYTDINIAQDFIEQVKQCQTMYKQSEFKMNILYQFLQKK